MYTFAQLANENNTHTGFYIILVFVGLCVALALLAIADDSDARWREVLQVFGGALLVLVYPFYLSFLKEVPVPRNEAVTATLVENASWNRAESCGKYSTCDYSYVVYMTPEGEVSFRRGQGIVYPKTAILYKN